MSWREATLKTSGATTRQVKRSGVAYEGLAFFLKRNLLDSRSNFPLTFRQGKRKKKNKISLLNKFVNKLKRRLYTRMNDGTRKKRMEIQRLSTLLAGLSAWPSYTPHMHTVAGSLRGLTRGRLSCLAMPEYPAGSARRATALQYLLHMPGSVRSEKEPASAERDGARSLAIYRVLEFRGRIARVWLP